jgi:L-fuconolactonase
MPNFPIIDAHVHLYDVNRFSYGWLANVPKINRSYGLEDFDTARGPVVVDRLVFA